MDVPLSLVEEIALPLPLSSTSCDALRICRLADNVFLVSSTPGLVQLVLLSSDRQPQVIAQFNPMPEAEIIVMAEDRGRQRATSVFDPTLVAFDAPVERMLYVRGEGLIFMLVGSCLRTHGYDSARVVCYPGPIIVPDGATDFDVCRCPTVGVMCAVLSDNNQVQVFAYKDAEALLVNEGSPRRLPRQGLFRKVRFVSASVLCCYDDWPGAGGGYYLIAADTLTGIGFIPVSPGPHHSLMASPIFDGMQRTRVHDELGTTRSSDEGDAVSQGQGQGDECRHSNKFVVLTFNTDQYLEYTAEVMRIDDDGEMTSLLVIPMVCVAPPTAMTSIGPWLVVSLPYAVEYYDWQGGDFAQSVLDEAGAVRASWDSRTLDLVRTQAESVYRIGRNDLVVGFDPSPQQSDRLFVYDVATRPIIDVVLDLMESGSFQGLQATDLMMYGHEIGVRALVGGTAYGETLNAVINNVSFNMLQRNTLFNEYGLLLSKFVHMAPNATAPIPATTKHCTLCKAKFSLLTKARRCALCATVFCDDCCGKHNLREYGFVHVDPAAPIFPVCNDCIVYADQTLYLLMASKRFVQVLHYMAEFPAKAAGFDFDQVVGITLNQCFIDRRYELCARLVERYVGDLQGWQEWIRRFGGVKQLRALAKAINVYECDKAINTTMLAQVMKVEPQTLRALVKQWPTSRFDTTAVSDGIELILKRRIADATALQTHCETGPVSADDRRSAVGLLFEDHDTSTLLLSLLHIYTAKREELNVVRAFVEHYEQFQMSSEERAERRPRCDAVMEAPDAFGSMPTHRECEINFIHACRVQRTGHHRSVGDWRVLDICEFIRERELFPIVLSPINEDYTVMLTMLRLHPAQICDFFESLEVKACLGLLDVVMHHLQAHPLGQLHLLDALSERNIALTHAYHDRLANLYIDHLPRRVLWLVKMKQVSNVDWKNIFQRTQERRMYAEMVYAVGRMGNDRDAIRIAVRNLKSVHFAMQYVVDAAKEDQEVLWEDLTNHVIQSGELIGDFLDHIALYRNPADFLTKIPDRNRLVIPDEGRRLHRIVAEKRCDEAIVDSSVAALKQDNMKAMHRLMASRRRAVRFEGGHNAGSYSVCGICHRRLAGGDVAVANCGHSFHPACLVARYELYPYSPPMDAAAARAIADAERERAKEAARVRAAKRAMAIYRTFRSEGCGDLFAIVPNHVLCRVLGFLRFEDRVRLMDVSVSWRETIETVEPTLIEVLSDRSPNLVLRYRYLQRTKATPTFRNTVCASTINFGDHAFETTPESTFIGPQCTICDS